MSGSTIEINSLSGVRASNASKSDLTEAFSNILELGLHGISFSPYTEGQAPGDSIDEAQIRSRMRIIAPHTKWVRSFSCTEGNEKIPVVAKELGLKTLVGAWLGKDEEKNKRELSTLIELGQSGMVDIVAVGNEVLYREEMTEDALLETIRFVKGELPENQVGYVDAYYEFCNRPALTDACDVILANCYPFWEGCHSDYSLLYIKEMYRRVCSAVGNKPVIISETGWPNGSKNFGDSQPSDINALSYFVNVQQWAREDNVDMFYFSSFDEAWKTGDEGDVGAYWGLWDSNGQLKYVNHE